jgi:drug/metabolite transporter (DMT)-like permease
VLGLTLGLACGLAYTGNTIFSKRLSDAGLSPLSTLALRFQLMVVVSWIMVIADGGPGIGRAIVPAALLALINVVQSYLGQVGIKYVEPITASLLDTLSPLCAFLLQLFDGRLAPSGFTLACIVAITGLVALGVVARHRFDVAQSAQTVQAPHTERAEQVEPAFTSTASDTSAEPV